MRSAARVAVTAIAVATVIAACGTADSGPAAPAVGTLMTTCSETACIDHPVEWDVEVGETYLSFRHPADPGRVVASVGQVDMAALVETVGGSWPAPPRRAIEAFWDLIGGGEASLDRIETRGDGAVRSEGVLEGLRMWHLLVPGFGRSGIGVEVRAPNRTWVDHADAFLGSLRER